MEKHTDSMGDDFERRRANRERWLNRTITPAERDRVARHDALMAAYYGAVAAWKNLMIARENIDPDDPNLATDVREVQDITGVRRPQFREFLVHHGDMQRNPALHADDDIDEDEYILYVDHGADPPDLDLIGGAFGV